MIRWADTRENPFEEGVFVEEHNGKLIYLVCIGGRIFHYDDEKDALEIYNMWRGK